VREKGIVGPSPSEKSHGAEAEAGDAPECIVDGSRQSQVALQPGEARASSHTRSTPPGEAHPCLPRAGKPRLPAGRQAKPEADCAPRMEQLVYVLSA